MNERGYSLVEMLVALTILLVVFGSLCEVLSPAHATALVQAELQDMQQRARVVSDRLTHDLWLAGAGATSGTRGGPLARYFAAVLPDVCCGPAADPAGSSFSDRVTMVYLPRGSPEAALASPIAADSLRLDLASGPSCPTTMPVCGFADGDLLVVFDDSGRYDFFTLDLASGVPTLHPEAGGFDARYETGSTVCRAVIHSYFREAGSNRLFAVDGFAAAQPFVDGVSALRFDYGDLAAMALNPMFGDGPWRGSAGTAYDADVLRIRRVRVSFSIRSGIDLSGSMRVPDLTSSFEVALRNAGGLP